MTDVVCIANNRLISERHPNVENRKYKGLREIDTVHCRGSSDYIVTIIERKTGFVMVGKLLNKTTVHLNNKTKALINRGHAEFKTITADNGTEFHEYSK